MIHLGTYNKTDYKSLFIIPNHLMKNSQKDDTQNIFPYTHMFNYKCFTR